MHLDAAAIRQINSIIQTNFIDLDTTRLNQLPPEVLEALTLLCSRHGDELQMTKQLAVELILNAKRDLLEFTERSRATRMAYITKHSVMKRVFTFDIDPRRPKRMPGAQFRETER